jgi:hypothetical protein
MHFSSTLKKERYRFALFSVLFTVILLLTQQEISGAPLTDIPMMDAEATQLLEQLKTGFDAYESQFKSGEVEFTITVHTVTQHPIPVGTKPNYEEQGHWQITYQFDEEHQFYDIKARKKIELGRRTPLLEWTDIHHQYLVKEKTLHVWEKIGTEWKQHPPQKMSSTSLEYRFNPHWWRWNLPPPGSKRLFRGYKTVEIKNVEIHGIPHLKLSLYRPGEERLDPNTTYEIWIDPQKDYHVTQMIGYGRGIYENFVVKADGTHNPERRSFLRRTHTTYQLARYEPGIWFPKTVTQQWTNGRDISEIFPDIPATEVPLLMNEAFISEATLAERLQPYGTYTMQVQRAIFNIPIQQKNLPITLDK